MSLIGIINGNRREVPKELRVVNQKLFESDFANSEGGTCCIRSRKIRCFYCYKDKKLSDCNKKKLEVILIIIQQNEVLTV